MVPPQFAADAASWDPDRSAGCIGPYPSSPTVLQQSHSERNSISAFSLSRSNRQLSGRTPGCVLVFITVLCIYVFHSLTLHCVQVNTKLQTLAIIRCLYLCILQKAVFCLSPKDTQMSLHKNTVGRLHPPRFML